MNPCMFVLQSCTLAFCRGITKNNEDKCFLPVYFNKCPFRNVFSPLISTFSRVHENKKELELRQTCDNFAQSLVINTKLIQRWKTMQVPLRQDE